MLRLILQETSFQFNGKDFLQTHGTAMGTKTAVSFANIFMAKIETAIIDQHSTKPLLWKRYIDDVFSLWDTNREEINNFIERANNYHPTIKFTADIRGCLHDTGATFAPQRVHSGSLSWLYICLHDTTTKSHAGATRPCVSSLRLSHRGENFTPVRNLATVSCKHETTTRFGVKSV